MKGNEFDSKLDGRKKKKKTLIMTLIESELDQIQTCSLFMLLVQTPK